MKSILHILTSADLHVERGSYSKARKLYTQAYQLQKRELGADHSDALITLYELGLVNCALNRTDEATAIFADLLDRRTRLFGPDDEYVKEIRHLMSEDFADIETTAAIATA